jgi:hypothetical protein
MTTLSQARFDEHILICAQTVFSSSLIQTVAVDDPGSGATRLKLTSGFWIFAVVTLACMLCTLTIFGLLQFVWQRSQRSKQGQIG